MAIDSLVEHVSTYNRRAITSHLYVGPFVVLYAVWFYAWIFHLGLDDFWEAGCIATAGLVILQILTLLFGYWFVSINCILTCNRETDPRKATLARVDPTPNNGWAELVPLLKTNLPDGTVRLSFVFQKVSYVFDDEKHEFRSLEFDTNKPFKYYKGWRGYDSQEEIDAQLLAYGNNKMEMKVPQFSELFAERATAPFFVFQVFCVGLWCLEDLWYYSLFTLMMLVTFEATVVKQQIRNMSEIHNMGNKPYPINVYRNKKWQKIPSDELVSGDIISLSRSVDERSVPCDVLILRGHCIVDESMLTGESIPQMKESIEDVDSELYFDYSSSRLHVISGGTKIVQHTAAKSDGGLRGGDSGVQCYVLKTGFNTSQGSLLRTIMFGVKRVTANNLETFGFIVFLLIFAVAAAAYLWIQGTKDESRNKFKLFLECSLIITSVIPPELPIELSLAVNNSLIALQKLGVFCTEPFRIPFAGKVDICCFDKTGTLTTDALVVEGIAGLGKNSLDEDGNVVVEKDTAKTPPTTAQVLAACHSLVKLEDELVGDPLEKACLTWINWTLSKSGVVMPKSGKASALKIVHRFHFLSQLKRMSVIASYTVPGFPDPHYLALVKGAPEVLHDMFAEVPPHYQECYQKLALSGARIIALGARELGSMTHQELRDPKREEFESRLTFAGFLVIHCPLKKDTQAMIHEIIESSHKVTMITGDNPLTACHVAEVLRFASSGSSIRILDIHDDGSEPRWASMDGKQQLDVNPSMNKRERTQFLKDYQLCLTGSGLDYLNSNYPDHLDAIISSVCVFARVSPKQKELIINRFKKLGYTTLMCGDGTNDVGALKHANVGVALLSHPLVGENNKKPKSVASPVPANTPPVPSIVNRRAGRRPGAPPMNPAVSSTQARLDNMLREIDEEESAKVIKLGDASIAAPFTSKYTSIQSICQVIKQGRCTLVTTLQMFKILALNALILAYSQSVLYLDGVKFSDTQATIQGLLLAACFLFVSRSRPLKVLSKQRPIPNIFNAYTLLTVTLQFAVHFFCLIQVVSLAHEFEPKAKVDLEADFAPNILNTAVYIMSVGLQVATFAVNYRGRPFMESLFENKPMLYSVVGSGVGVFLLAINAMPDINEKIQLAPLPDEFRRKLVTYVLGDLSVAFLIDRILNYAIGDMRA